METTTTTTTITFTCQTCGRTPDGPAQMRYCQHCGELLVEPKTKTAVEIPMKKSGRPFSVFALLLVIPLIAFIAAEGIQWKSDSTLRQTLLKEFPDKASAIDNVTVTSACENPDVRSDQGFSDICSENDNLGWMKCGAIVASCFVVLMVVVIKVAGIIALKRRTLLLLLFAPGLHLTMLAMSALTLLYAALGIAALYYGESALIGRVHIGIMLAFGIGAIVAVGSLIRAQFNTVRRASTTIIGKKWNASSTCVFEVLLMRWLIGWVPNGLRASWQDSNQISTGLKQMSFV
jgi:hypothetical protein